MRKWFIHRAVRTVACLLFASAAVACGDPSGGSGNADTRDPVPEEETEEEDERPQRETDVPDAGAEEEPEDAEPEVEAPLPPVTRTVTWHASESLERVADGIAEGCAFWLRVGVAFERVGDRASANIRFVENREDVCVERDDVARAFDSGNIVLCTDRMLLGDGELKELPAIVAHEVGHELGVEHVPYECGEGVAVHPSGAEVCGTAVMNAPLRAPNNLHRLTSVDLLAYDLRGDAWSDVPEDEPCVRFEEATDVD